MPTPARPTLFTFDIFGTVLDWRTGMSQSVGRPLDDATFDAVIDHQGRAEQTPPFRSYAAITAQSLVEVLGIEPERAAAIGAAVGEWPLFADSIEGMRRLRAIAPCAAMTNSDRAHGLAVQMRLGALDHWICAEAIGVYKPSPAFWHETARRIGQAMDRSWWHVSAYGDYDLAAARALGLTCVFVGRPHHRRGPADIEVADLIELAELAGQAGR